MDIKGNILLKKIKYIQWIYFVVIKKDIKNNTKCDDNHKETKCIDMVTDNGNDVGILDNCFSIVYNDDKYLLGFSNVVIFGHIVLIHI